VVFYWWSIVTMRLSCTVTEIWGPKDIWVTTMTFWGHVTSSATWPSDSAWAYWWSMMTSMRVMDTEIRGFKDFGVTSSTFWGHLTSSVTWPFDSAYVVSYGWSIGTICVYLAPLRRYKASKLHLPMRILRVTWTVCRGSKMTTYLEFPRPYCLFTVQLLWTYDDD